MFICFSVLYLYLCDIFNFSPLMVILVLLGSLFHKKNTYSLEFNKYFFFKKAFILIKFYINALKLPLYFNTVQFSTLRWRPLFKKSSYYGLYRSNKNQ